MKDKGTTENGKIMGSGPLKTLNLGESYYTAIRLS